MVLKVGRMAQKYAPFPGRPKKFYAGSNLKIFLVDIISEYTG